MLFQAVAINFSYFRLFHYKIVAIFSLQVLVVYVINDIPACILFCVILAEQIQLISINASTKILCSGVLSILGLIRDLKAFEFKNEALTANASNCSLFWGAHQGALP